MYCVFLVFISSSLLVFFFNSVQFSLISFLCFHSKFFSCLCFLCLFFVSAKSWNSMAGLEFKEFWLFPMFFLINRLNSIFLQNPPFLIFYTRNFPNQNAEINFLNMFFLQNIQLWESQKSLNSTPASKIKEIRKKQ